MDSESTPTPPRMVTVAVRSDEHDSWTTATGELLSSGVVAINPRDWTYVRRNACVRRRNGQPCTCNPVPEHGRTRLGLPPAPVFLEPGLRWVASFMGPRPPVQGTGFTMREVLDAATQAAADNLSHGDAICIFQLKYDPKSPGSMPLGQLRVYLQRSEVAGKWTATIHSGDPIRSDALVTQTFAEYAPDFTHSRVVVKGG